MVKTPLLLNTNIRHNTNNLGFVFIYVDTHEQILE